MPSTSPSKTKSPDITRAPDGMRAQRAVTKLLPCAASPKSSWAAASRTFEGLWIDGRRHISKIGLFAHASILETASCSNTPTSHPRGVFLSNTWSRTFWW